MRKHGKVWLEARRSTDVVRTDARVFEWTAPVAAAETQAVRREGEGAGSGREAPAPIGSAFS